MFSNTPKQLRIICTAIIGIFTVCALIYLSFRYIRILMAVIRWIFHLFSPFLLGIFFALTLNVPLHFFENRILSKKFIGLPIKYRRRIAIFLSLFFISALLSLIVFLIVPKLSEALISLVIIISDTLKLLSDLEGNFPLSLIPFSEYLTDFHIDWNAIALWIENLIPTFTKEMTERLPKIIASASDMFIDVFLGTIFSIYLLAKKEAFKLQFKELLCIWFPCRFLPILFHVGFVCIDTFRNFILGQSLEALILGTLCTIGMLCLQLPYALTIGVLVGVTAFLPFVGAYIGAFIGCLLILTVHRFQALIFLIFLFSLQQLEGNFIYPRIVGNRIHLPPILVLLSITVGGRLAGPLGMLLGVPAFSVIYQLGKEATECKKRNMTVTK